MNVVALVQPREPTELERLAVRITALLKSAEEADARADKRDGFARKQKWEAAKARGRALEKRTQAGFDLIEAKVALLAEDPDATFEAWCDANVNLPIRAVYRLMALARDYEKHRCLGVALGRPQAIWEGQGVEADEDGNLQHIPAALIDPVQRPRSVKTILTMFRKLPQQWRDLVQRELEEINAHDH